MARRTFSGRKKPNSAVAAPASIARATGSVSQKQVQEGLAPTLALNCAPNPSVSNTAPAQGSAVCFAELRSNRAFMPAYGVASWRQSP
jgi:hypothetical protein